MGMAVGGSVGTAVGSGVGFVVSSTSTISADTGMVQTVHSIRIMIIKKNRLFTVSLPVL